MSAPPSGKGEPVENKQQLVEWVASGEKTKDAWRIGTEHEKFVFRRSDLSPVPYEGPDGIKALLDALAERFGWERHEENGNVVALSRNACNITLEPGGQFELSGAPLRTIHETCAEVAGHLEECRSVAEPLGLGMLGVGFHPLWERSAIPWMPKGRYAIMRRYMQLKGTLGLDMMLRTCTVQVNLDYASEADMVTKLRVSLALQPLATALFANSPFSEGNLNGFKSYRAHVWTDTDPDRTGIPAFVFEDGMSYERWVDYALDTPMYFVYRDGQYIDVAGQSFRRFMDGELPGLPGELPTISDWADHVTTLFPEVRLKRYLEMRGADCGASDQLCGLPALWVGLLYDQSALDAAFDLVKDWTIEEMEAMREAAPRLGLQAPCPGGTLQDLARQVLAIAAAGLKARGRLDWIGTSEDSFLADLHETAASGLTPADRKVKLFQNQWGGSVRPMFGDYAY
ncbi:MAG TPA: glutamate--cysteine ligase [Geminicoccus sp.]|jgi:glutamate--cysteine ligase|uniref:glutamate--cysteine ligase n=1 Tax=Geminicoccus sp. TaxID=2024832 RepID=UPI002E2F68C5|nr:glutamate--cysteine ligase [Geminicoccus sp.]HEX2528077.1 glutamate--cysteine ligase [Geminicoccus sp.]